MGKFQFSYAIHLPQNNMNSGLPPRLGVRHNMLDIFVQRLFSYVAPLWIWSFRRYWQKRTIRGPKIHAYALNYTRVMLQPLTSRNYQQILLCRARQQLCFYSYETIARRSPSKICKKNVLKAFGICNKCSKSVSTFRTFVANALPPSILAYNLPENARSGCWSFTSLVVSLLAQIRSLQPRCLLATSRL